MAVERVPDMAEADHADALDTIFRDNDNRRHFEYRLLEAAILSMAPYFLSQHNKHVNLWKMNDKTIIFQLDRLRNIMNSLSMNQWTTKVLKINNFLLD